MTTEEGTRSRTVLKTLADVGGYLKNLARHVLLAEPAELRRNQEARKFLEQAEHDDYTGEDLVFARDTAVGVNEGDYQVANVREARLYMKFGHYCQNREARLQQATKLRSRQLH